MKEDMKKNNAAQHNGIVSGEIARLQGFEAGHPFVVLLGVSSEGVELLDAWAVEGDTGQPEVSHYIG